VTGRYAVVWIEGGGAARTGRLDAYPDRLELHGRDGDATVLLDGVVDVAIARGRGERLRGMAVVVIERHDGAHIRVASLGGPGLLYELAGLAGSRSGGVVGPPRHVRDERRSGAGRGFDRQRAADEREPLAHPEQAERPLAHLGGHEARAVVLD
jgi:hypothetical protein